MRTRYDTLCLGRWPVWSIRSDSFMRSYGQLAVIFTLIYAVNRFVYLNGDFVQSSN